ncbi:S10 family peptidase [candidate division KSB1 bacterium]
MYHRKFSTIILTILISLLTSGIIAQDTTWVKPKISVTEHSMKIGGAKVDYSVTCDMMPIFNYNGKQVAGMFYMAYVKDGVTDKSKRPLLFSFNGGPGTASVWLHMGVLGPRKVKFDDDGFALAPPFELEDNPYSILDIADVVFIDPIGTGYSRMKPGEDAHKFHGTMEDIESVGEFIRMYTTRNNRWLSPKFLIGESYGTTRASGLAGHLSEKHLMHINGVILVSSMSLNVDVGSDLNYALILPHYTATAWYHKKLEDDLLKKPLRAVLDEAEKFALGTYLDILVKGGNIDKEVKMASALLVSKYTGLSAQYIFNTNLRIDRGRFRKELLRDENRTVGRLDSRYKGIDRDAAGENYEYDQALSDWEGTFSAAFNSYIREELYYRTDMSYDIWGYVRPWKRDERVNVGEMLRSAMSQNRNLKVLILEGYYDAACDYFTAMYAFSHIDMNGELKDRIKFAFYESGHMMYAHKPSLIKMKKDIAEFINDSWGK